MADSKNGRQKPNKLSAKALARFRCLDCGVNVVTSGDWYMATSEIWEKLGLGWEDNLCVACLEKRLGRKLRPMLQDVHPASTWYEGMGLSERLQEIWRPKLKSRRPK
jgi:hypothetical protein